MENKAFIKKILVPVDKSDSSLMSQETAALIAKKTHASVTVLHVVPRMSYGKPETAALILSGLDQEGQKIVGEAKGLFMEEKVEVKGEVLHEEDVAEAILEFSADDFDLIVIGNRGENEKGLRALGSVTKKVIMHTSCPTMIVKKTSTLSNMLVCVDGSDHAMKALNYILGLAEKTGSRITLLNVQETRLHKASPDAAMDLGGRILTESLDTVEKRKLTADRRLEYGVPSDVIVDVAEKGNHDLIVLGSRGLGTVKRFLLGSVSDDVSYKAKCSVLIVPAKL
ncbi:MAG: universal stress protein [Candidatus Bathyarchaeia archaeon]|jgi:nucleotide-binding universal stress UspA family protein